MNPQEKWRIWRWLLANGKAGKFQHRRNIIKDREIVGLIDGLDAEDLEALFRGPETARKHSTKPITGKPTRPPKTRLKSDPEWTKSARMAFFASDAWRRLRYEVLKRDNGICVLCGRGRPDGVILHVDHIKPASTHPSLRLAISNLQVLCEDCNLGKSNTDDTDWR